MILPRILLFPPLRASPVPVGEFHDFPADFPVFALRTTFSPRILMFPPLRASPVPVGEFSRCWADFTSVPRFRVPAYVFARNTDVLTKSSVLDTSSMFWPFRPPSSLVLTVSLQLGRFSPFEHHFVMTWCFPRFRPPLFTAWSFDHRFPTFAYDFASYNSTSI